jgi:hypothetical protein
MLVDYRRLSDSIPHLTLSHTQQKEQKKRTNNDVRSNIQKTKTKDWVTRTTETTRVNSCAPNGQRVPDPHVAPFVLILIQTRW